MGRTYEKVKIFITTFAFLLFFSIVVFTNDGIKASVKFADDIVFASKITLFILALVVWILFPVIINPKLAEHDNKEPFRLIQFNLKRVIEKEYQKNRSQHHMGMMSIILSVSMMIFSFLIIGSRMVTDIRLIVIFLELIRLLLIIYSIYIYYVIFYSTRLQFKRIHNWMSYITVPINLLSLSYFVFVTVITLQNSMKDLNF